MNNLCKENVAEIPNKTLHEKSLKEEAKKLIINILSNFKQKFDNETIGLGVYEKVRRHFQDEKKLQELGKSLKTPELDINKPSDVIKFFKIIHEQTFFDLEFKNHYSC